MLLQIEYIKIFQDSLSLFFSCRYVTLRSSYTILVSERDTPILILSWYRNVASDPYSILVSERDTPILIYYPGTGTWHPIHILSWCRNVTPDPYTILVPERGTRSIFYPGVGTWHSDPHILSWYQNVAPDPYSILVSERDHTNRTFCLVKFVNWEAIEENPMTNRR